MDELATLEARPCTAEGPTRCWQLLDDMIQQRSFINHTNVLRCLNQIWKEPWGIDWVINMFSIFIRCHAPKSKKLYGPGSELQSAESTVLQAPTTWICKISARLLEIYVASYRQSLPKYSTCTYDSRSIDTNTYSDFRGLRVLVWLCFWTSGVLRGFVLSLPVLCSGFEISQLLEPWLVKLPLGSIAQA